jgi:hypothetical protein
MAARAGASDALRLGHMSTPTAIFEGHPPVSYWGMVGHLVPTIEGWIRCARMPSATTSDSTVKHMGGFFMRSPDATYAAPTPLYTKFTTSQKQNTGTYRNEPRVFHISLNNTSPHKPYYAAEYITDNASATRPHVQMTTVRTRSSKTPTRSVQLATTAGTSARPPGGLLTLTMQRTSCSLGRL